MCKKSKKNTKYIPSYSSLWSSRFYTPKAVDYHQFYASSSALNRVKDGQTIQMCPHSDISKRSKSFSIWYQFHDLPYTRYASELMSKVLLQSRRLLILQFHIWKCLQRMYHKVHLNLFSQFLVDCGQYLKLFLEVFL